MPYIYISSTRIHKECVSLLICFLIAIGFNVYAIIHYDTPEASRRRKTQTT